MQIRENRFKGLRFTAIGMALFFSLAGLRAAAQCTTNADSGVTVNTVRSNLQSKIQGSNWQAQTFTVEGSGCFWLNRVTFSLRKEGSPGNLVVEVYDAASGTPAWPGVLGGSAAPLAVATVAASAVSTSYGDITVTFGSPAQLSGGSQYALVVHQTGGSGQNYYNLGLTDNNPYAGGRFCKANSTAWDCPNGPGGGLDVRMSICVTPCQNGCTLTQGFWKNHGNDWPAAVLNSGLALGNVNYSYLELMAIFHQSVGGNGLISMGHQLIAAKLNVLNGAPAPSAVQAAIASADALLGDQVIPPVGSDYERPSVTSSLVGSLTQFNEGVFPGGPSHCDN